MSKRTVTQKISKPAAWVWALVALGVIIVAVLIWTSLPAPAQETSLATTISVDQAVQLRDSGAFILDVRTPEEWNELHIPNSTLIPLDQLAGRVGEVPTGQTVVVVCRSGNRSQSGRDILLQAGYDQVTSMSGGITEWRALGHPITTGP